MQRKKISPGDKIPVKLTVNQRDLIREHTLYNPNFAELAAADGKDIRIEMTLDDIDEILGYIAAEANHCDNAKTRKLLDALYDKFEEILEQYDDQEE